MMIFPNTKHDMTHEKLASSWILINNSSLSFYFILSSSSFKFVQDSSDVGQVSCIFQTECRISMVDHSGENYILKASLDEFDEFRDRKNMSDYMKYREKVMTLKRITV